MGAGRLLQLNRHDTWTLCLPSQQSGLDLEFPMTKTHILFWDFLLGKSCKNWCAPDKLWPWWQNILNRLYLQSLIWDEDVLTPTVWEKKHWHCSHLILKSKCESFRKSLVWNSAPLKRKLIRKYLSDKPFLIDKAQTMAALNSGSCMASSLHTHINHLITGAMAVGSLCELVCIAAFASYCMSSSQNQSPNYRIILST